MFFHLSTTSLPSTFRINAEYALPILFTYTRLVLMIAHTCSMCYTVYSDYYSIIQ